MYRPFLVLSLFVFCIFCAEPVYAFSSFVADAVQTEPGHQTRRGKLYVSKLGTRFEFTENKQKVIQIIQPANGLFRLMFPNTKTYFEIRTRVSVVAAGGRQSKTPCLPGPRALCRKVGYLKTAGGGLLERWVIGAAKDGGRIKVLWDPARHMFIQQILPDGSKMEAHMSGVTVFEGRSVERWEMTVTMLSGFRQKSYMLFAPDIGYPVMEQGGRGRKKELHNIKLHTPDSTLFIVPPDYKKLPFPTRVQGQESPHKPDQLEP